MFNYKILFAIAFVAVTGCAVSSTDGGTAPTPETTKVEIKGFHFDHTLTGYEGCQNARSLDLTKVKLVGDTCMDDGSECFDIAKHQVDVYYVDGQVDNAPFGASTFVETVDCQ